MKNRRGMRATVQKVFKASPMEPEQAPINVNEAEELYREIRVQYELIYESGNEAKLESGTEVDVVIEADCSDIAKNSNR